MGNIGEITPIKINRHTGQFPVSAQSILTAADFLGICISSFDWSCYYGIWQGMTCTEGMGINKAYTSQMRQMKFNGRTLLSVPFHNVALRIGPAVAKRGSVRSCPDTKGIHHQDDAAFHDSHSLCSSSSSPRLSIFWKRTSARW